MRSAISAAVGTVCLVSAVAAAPTAFATPTPVQRTFVIRVTPASFAESAPGSFAGSTPVAQTAFAGSAPAAWPAGVHASPPAAGDVTAQAACNNPRRAK